MTTLLYDWPYLALACGVLGTLALILWPRATQAIPRWKDPAWLACLVLPVYMLHQFEEHGIDLLGRRYHFLTDLCTTLGHPNLADCPGDAWFIFAVNVGGVWIAGACAILWRRTNPLVAACAFGIPIVNAVAHLAPAVAHRTYNPGVLTAVLLFVPLGAWVVLTFVARGAITKRQIPLILASGVVVHVVLLAALLAYANGFLPRVPMLAIQVANGFVPLAIATIARREAT